MPIFCSKCGKENRNTSKFCSICATPLPINIPIGLLQTGTMLENRYKIITLIKTGGMGAVYKAVDEKLENICAIKELLPPVYGKQEEYKQITEWFKREAKILAKLDHPNLPKVSDYFAYKGRYYLIMNFIDGENLETILHKEGKPGLQEEKVIEWAKQVLNILKYLHNLQPPVIYRDIKPSNIMLHRDGRAMLIDFGIARIINHDSQIKKTAIGTSGYAPVEQCRGNAEPRSDLYALGATIHYLLTGIEPLPFKFDPLRKMVPSISVEVEDIVMKSLKDRIDERFIDAEEMLKALDVKDKYSIDGNNQKNSNILIQSSNKKQRKGTVKDKLEIKPLLALQAKKSIKTSTTPVPDIYAFEKDKNILVKRYSLIQKIGEGSMGKIYKARDLSTNQTVAIKLLHPELQFGKYIYRFKKVAEDLSKLSHPNIVTFYSLEQDEKNIFLVMEYIVGKKMKTYIEHSSSPMEDVLKCAIQICNALDSAHSMNMIHRDIKPENILINSEANIKILNFGIPQFSRKRSLCEVFKPSKDLQYLAPEYIRGEQFTNISDLYSLGVTLYELLTHQLPFSEGKLNEVFFPQLFEVPIPPTKVNKNIPYELELTLIKLLDKTPTRRFENAKKLKERLIKILKEL
jgi:serine/threonine protein kinase